MKAIPSFCNIEDSIDPGSAIAGFDCRCCPPLWLSLYQCTAPLQIRLTALPGSRSKIQLKYQECVFLYICVYVKK